MQLHLGLRIGIASSTEKTMQLLNSIAHPYPLNTLSLSIAAYLLEHPERLRAFMADQRRLSAKLKKIFNEGVADILSVLPSETNFVFTYGELAPSLGQWIIDTAISRGLMINQASRVSKRLCVTRSPRMNSWMP